MSFNVVRSSAGSGKTFTLVQFYLRLILSHSQPDYFKHILAITFTNKATNEMKERILLALNSIAEQDDEFMAMKSALETDLNLSAENLADRAKNTLNSVLHGYGDFNISTIDRFVYRIIRTFAFELDLPAGLEIEFKKDRLITKVVDALFDAMSGNEDLVNVLLEFSAYKFSLDKSYDLEFDLHRLTDEMMKSGDQDYLRQLQDYDLNDFLGIRKKIQSELKELKSRLRKQSESMRNVIKSEGIESNWLYQGGRGLIPFLEKCDSPMADWPEPNSYVRALPERDSWESGSCPPEQKKSIETLAEMGRSELSGLVELCDDLAGTFQLQDVLSQQIYSMALANEVYRLLNHVKEQNSLVQLDDFNRMIAQIVAAHPVPYIYERVGERLRHYLIDEFQDTSFIQWHNLMPLLENALGEGNESLVVGDAKQAIYRWRGGEVSLLANLPHVNATDELTKEREQAFVQAYNARQLSHNFRSSPVIISLVNAVFDQIKSDYKEVAGGIYDQHEQQAHTADSAGSVVIQFTDSETTHEQELQDILDGIHEFLSFGFTYGDMAVLCRTRSDCQDVAALLIDQGISVLSDESLLLISSSEVNFIVDCLSYCFKPYDEGITFRILQYLFQTDRLAVKSMDDLLVQWRKNQNLSSFSLADGSPLDISAGDEDLIQLVHRLTSTIVKSVKPDIYAITFENMVNQFIRDYGNNPLEFLEWWEGAASDIKIELTGAGDAVQIMTIHKAKGLEFEIVFFPFVHGQVRPGKEYLWVTSKGSDQDLLPVMWLPVSKLENTDYRDYWQTEMHASLLDTINILYVGFTRAKKHLRVYSRLNNSKGQGMYEEKILKSSLSQFEPKDEGVKITYHFGQLSRSDSSSEKKAVNNLVLNALATGDWHDKLQLKYRIDEEPLGSENKAVREGNLVHNALAALTDLEELNPEWLIQFGKDQVDTISAVEICSSITDTIKGSVVEKYFYQVEGRVMNEREIIDHSGNKFRPDRCILSNNEVVVMDYKTGAELPEHYDQVRRYLNLFSNLNYEVRKGFLIYLNEHKIIEVT